MSVEVVTVNRTEQLTCLLVNLVISNDFVDQVKLGQLEDEEEYKEFTKKIFTQWQILMV